MAIEFIDINKGKEHLKSNTSAAKEITEASVKESVISSTLNILRGITIGKDKKAVDIKYVLQQSKKESKVWVLTLKYGVAPVSMAKITASSLEEAKSDAIKYVEGLKTKMSDNVASQIRAAVDSKKKSLAKAKKTRDEAKKKA
ncbi:hypothetical protein EB001_18180 [bacterium]|jgi:hypothetical protein|nr:hypothetical protein [bacterium]